MYTPKHFEEPRIEILHELMRNRSLATLIAVGSRGLVANHLPLYLDRASAPLGVLRGHVSRSNPVWKDFDPTVEALAVFSGPDAYITPSWYATKRETGQAVPTWNYVVAHAYGPMRAIEDPAWLRAHVEELTRHNEEGRAEPWKVEDAPPEYIARLLAGIVGLEIKLSRIEGKWKVSQNQPEANRHGVIAGLEASGDAEAIAVAALVRERGGTA
ncbi:MAG: FMN-binding negative transcriptional regulator [Vicinamibacteria bacterium]